MKYGFQGPLVTELKGNSDKIHILREPLIYLSRTYGPIILPVEFETDFCTVPRVPIAYQLWGGRNHREGALHDYLFRTDSKPNLGFMACNYVFLEAMASRGVASWIRYPMYAGVCAGGYFHYHKRSVGDKL